MKSFEEIARELSEQLQPYLAIGIEPEDIYPAILDALLRVFPDA